MHKCFNIVLHEPEIPQNTGNIVRLCAGTKSSLHLIHPLGFSTEDKYLKRAGLDYWDFVKVEQYENFEDFLNKNQDGIKYFLTTRSPNNYTERKFSPGDYFIFGKESAGIPDSIIREHWQNTLSIPIIGKVRSFNLANSASIILFEALRQNNFFENENI